MTDTLLLSMSMSGDYIKSSTHLGRKVTAGGLRAEPWKLQAVSAEGPDGRWRRKNTSVSGDGRVFLKALVLARERSASSSTETGDA